MERALSQDERIRRAEEIYARRQNARERTTRATVNISSSEPKNFKLFKRLALQAFICVLIYFIFHLINTTNYSFSKATMEKTEELISQEVDFAGIFTNITNYIGSYISSIDLKNEEIISKDNEINENTISSEEHLQNNEINMIEQSTENVIESSQVVEEQNIAVLNNGDETSQEEVKDVELSETDRIKQKYSFILPVERMGFI